MMKLQQSFLCILIPVSFFTIIFKLPNLVPGYSIIAIGAVGVYLYSLKNLSLGGFKDELVQCFNQRLLFFLGLIFCALILISTVLSSDIPKTIRGLLLLIFLVVMIYHLYCKNSTAKQVKMFFLAMIISVLVFQVVNALVMFAHLSIPPIFQNAGRGYLFNGNMIFNSNTSGAMIAFSIPAVVKLCYVSKGRCKRLYYIVGVVFVSFLVLSVSRASFLMVATYFATLLGLMFRRSIKLLTRTLFSILLTVILVSILFPGITSKLFRLNQGLSSRELLWAKGIELIQSKPLFGFGFRTVPEVQIEGLPLYNFHNIYIGMAVELGLLATVVFLVLSFYYLYIAVQKTIKIEHNETQFIAFSCVSFIVSVMIHQIFEQMLFFFGTHYYATVYFLVYLAILNTIIYKEKVVCYTRRGSR